ncbi:MAG TPA: response regulator [Azospirillaceae bacterium]|nr:response regulator [Azospirillaceae bacterium]
MLIVEDEHLNALFVATEFEAAGFVAHIAHDGLEALRVLSEHRVDAVLTDIRMPNMDGADLVRHLKRAGITAPILVMTGVPYEAAELPVEEIFPKPLFLPRVIQTVKSRIRRTEPSADGSPVASC